MENINLILLLVVVPCNALKRIVFSRCDGLMGVLSKHYLYRATVKAGDECQYDMVYFILFCLHLFILFHFIYLFFSYRSQHVRSVSR